MSARCRIALLLFFAAWLSPFLLTAATFEQTTYGELDHWASGGNARTRLPGFQAFQKSCIQLLKAKKAPHVEGVSRTLADWRAPCKKVTGMRMESLSENDIREFFEAHFDPFRIVEGKKSEAFFTGYFEMEIKGSRTKQGGYIYPIYGKPKDMKKGKPYLTRAEINRGALEGKGLEIAYTDDPVRLFFLQVQGSGRVSLNDGSMMHLGFAAKNEQPYISIGKYLKDTGKLKGKNITAQQVMEWLRAHPKEAKSVMEQNPSFIFFKEIGKDGPFGSAGIQLTPEGSLAVDPKYIPLHAPLWVDTQINMTGKEDEAYFRLLTAQDTGSAIVGPLRGDIFFGFGPSAEAIAGRTQAKGALYLFLPKSTSHD